VTLISDDRDYILDIAQLPVTVVAIPIVVSDILPQYSACHMVSQNTTQSLRRLMLVIDFK